MYSVGFGKVLVATSPVRSLHRVSLTHGREETNLCWFYYVLPRVGNQWASPLKHCFACLQSAIMAARRDCRI